MPKLTFVDVWSEVSWKPSYQLVPIFLVKNPSRPICQKVWQLRKNATGKTGGNQHLENRKFQMQHEDMNEGVLLRKIFLVISNRLENPWWIPFKQGSIFFRPLSWIEIPEGIRYHIYIPHVSLCFHFEQWTKTCVPLYFGLWRRSLLLMSEILHPPSDWTRGLKSDGSAHEAKRWAAKNTPGRVTCWITWYDFGMFHHFAGV